MIREYLDIKYNIVETNGKTYSLLLSPNTSSEQVNELLKICGQAIAKYHFKKSHRLNKQYKLKNINKN